MLVLWTDSPPLARKIDVHYRSSGPSRLRSTGPPSVVESATKMTKSEPAKCPVERAEEPSEEENREQPQAKPALGAGGCLCGAVRFFCTSPSERSLYCHCTRCRRISGAPIFLGLLVQRSALTVEGEVRTYASSQHGVRHFCAHCGSSLFLSFKNRPDKIEIVLGSLDDSRSVEPDAHVFCESKIPWFDTVDCLPRFQRGITQD